MASHLILLEDSNILMLRRFNTGYEDGNYSVIAGHVSSDESFTQAIVREAKEEANIEIEYINLQVLHVMHRRKVDEVRIDVFIKANKWKNEPTNMEPNKCDDLRWFPIQNPPKNVVPYIKFAIECINRNEFYSEFGWCL
jgi:ADP-ribose pyrophosphatase YjhB (NUDIX family)